MMNKQVMNQAGCKYAPVAVVTRKLSNSGTAVGESDLVMLCR